MLPWHSPHLLTLDRIRASRWTTRPWRTYLARTDHMPVRQDRSLLAGRLMTSMTRVPSNGRMCSKESTLSQPRTWRMAYRPRLQPATSIAEKIMERRSTSKHPTMTAVGRTHLTTERPATTQMPMSAGFRDRRLCGKDIRRYRTAIPLALRRFICQLRTVYKMVGWRMARDLRLRNHKTNMSRARRTS